MALEPADLQRDLLQRGAGDGHCRAELGVPVALDDLGGDGRRLQPQLPAHLLFQVGIDVGEVAHRSGEPAHGDGGPGPAQALHVAPGLGVPDSRLETEGGGLGMDTVGAADHQRVLVAPGQVPEGPPQPFLAHDQEVGSVPELQGQRGVPDVHGGQAHVDEARVLAQVLLEVGEEGDELVLHALLDFPDPGHVHPGPGADAGEGLGRDAAAPRIGLTDGELHSEPGPVLFLLAPQAGQGRSGVPLDHALTLNQSRLDGKPVLGVTP
jgi:hypothetical protein